MSSALEKLRAITAARKAAELAAQSNPQQAEEPSNTNPDSGNTGTSSSPAVPVLASSQSESVAETSVQEEVTSPAKSEKSDHPLVMELAELEQALTEKLPEFKTILRDIHSKLRQDTELVAALSEEEIELIVTGLTRHASLEIIAPKAAKAARAAKKVPVTAADL